MKKILINIVLFFVATFLLLTLGIYGLIYGLILTIFTNGGVIKFWGDTLYQLNVGIDQLGNVMLSVFLNSYMLKEYKIYPFGNVNQTISHVLAVNHLHHNNCTNFGIWLINVLEFIDPGHTIDSL